MKDYCMKKIFLMFFAIICNGIYCDSLMASANHNNSQPSKLAQLKTEFTIPNKATIKNIQDMATINNLDKQLSDQYDKVNKLLQSKHEFSERYQTGLYRGELIQASCFLVQQILYLESQEHKETQEK